LPLIWSADALADLAEIWSYYANVAQSRTADNIIRRIENASQVLERYPLAGRARDEIRPGLRSMAARPYVVFYRVRGDVAEAVRVLHGRRDIDEIFAPNE
jgi:toxin ParE1/3/4